MEGRTRGHYWNTRTRLSRRRMLAGAASLAGVGAAGIALARCGGGSDGGTPTGTTAAAGRTRGGVVHAAPGFQILDREGPQLDADRGANTVPVGFTNLGILQYASYQHALMEGGFAAKWEQPDPQTVNLTVRDNMYWHDKPPVNGRLARADDLVHHIIRGKENRLLDGTTPPEKYRMAHREDYAIVDSVRAVDPLTVSIKLSRPSALFLTTLCNYTLVQAPEAIPALERSNPNPTADLVIGTGPFQLTRYEEPVWELKRFEKFHTDVWFDGILSRGFLGEIVREQHAFEQKDVDFMRTPTPAIREDIKARLAGQVHQTRTLATNPIAGTYYGGTPPWNNENLVGAIFRALDRQQLIKDIYRDEGVLASNIPPAQQLFAIPEKELRTMPGYLDDHAKDVAEAKKMWEAGGGPALGPVIVDIPDIFEGSYSGISSIITGQLRAALGGEWEPRLEPYYRISAKIAGRNYGNGANNIWFGWIADATELEPSTALWQAFSSRSQLFPVLGGVKLDRVNSLTDELVLEPLVERRKALCVEIDRELVSHYGAGIPGLINGFTDTLYWNYYRLAEPAPFRTYHQVGTQHWFDQSDPTWQGRPV